MKRNYESPELSLIKTEATDIITTSPGTDDVYILGGIFADGGKVNLYGGT